MSAILRFYQSDIVSACERHAAAGNRRVLVVLPTGGGKTMIFLQFPYKWRNKKWLIVVPSEEIFRQVAKALTRMNVPHTTLAAGEKPHLSKCRVLLAMSQTLSNRLAGGDLFADWTPDGIILDEFHRLIEQHANCLDWFEGKQVFAFSATPCRLDNRDLFDLCPWAVIGPPLAELQRLGYLVPECTFPMLRPDLKKIKIINGDLDTNGVEKELLTDRVLGIVVESYKKLANGQRAIAFSTGVDVSRAVVAVFNKAGIRAVHCDANTPPAERKAAVEDLRAGRIKLISNVGLFVEGVDIVEVSCIILLFATMSLAKFMQAAGRGTRVSPKTGKKRLIIIDMGGNSYRHGCISAPRNWRSNGQLLTTESSRCHVCACLIWGRGYTVCSYCGTPAKRPVVVALPPPTVIAGPAAPVAAPRVPTGNLRLPRPVPLAHIRRANEWRRLEKARAAAGLPFLSVDVKFAAPNRRSG